MPGVDGASPSTIPTTVHVYIFVLYILNHKYENGNIKYRVVLSFYKLICFVESCVPLFSGKGHSAKYDMANKAVLAN